MAFVLHGSFAPGIRTKSASRSNHPPGRLLRTWESSRRLSENSTLSDLHP